MFCDRCGQQLRDDAEFCTACGKALGPPPARVVRGRPADGRVERHIKVVAALWLVYALLRLLEMGWILLVGRTFLPSVVQNIVIGVSPFPRLQLGRLISGGLLLVGFWVGAFAVAELVTAWGLVERRPWARTLALIVGIVALLRFPFGTALGIYTLWVFLPGPAAQEYERLSRSPAG
ncbi:MAG TPA: zinc ribbon domain-containing protein [Candidatus Cybelea sp.]|nr:zinc ribbon domain-containing protein [Candidatus Cybelea sp.]